MNKNSMRIAACALAGTFVLSGYNSSLNAQVSNSTNLPAAGIAVVLEEGTTIQELTKEVIQNIAYLESASGIQPNIVIASEKVAMADIPVTAAAYQTTGMLSTLAEAAPDIEMSTEPEVSTEADNTEVDSDVQETEETKSSEEIMTEESEAETVAENETESVTDDQPETVAENEIESVTDDEPETQTSEVPGISEVPDAELIGADDSVKDENESDEVRTSAGFSAVDIFTSVDKTEESETVKEPETEETDSDKDNDEQDFTGLVIAQVNDYVNVRSTPGEDGEVVGKLYDKSVGEYVEEENGWYKITSGNCTGYVKADYCVTGDKAQSLAKEVGTTYAVVNTTTLKVREDANTDSSVLGLVPIDEELVVLEDLGDWVKVAIEEGDGYVSKEYIKLRTDFVHAESKEEEEARLAEEAREREEARAAAEAAEEKEKEEKKNNDNKKSEEKTTQKQEKNQETIAIAENTVATSSGSGVGKTVADYALQFVGNPYVYGGSSLTNGTDCSGFVMSVYNNFGVSLPHSSSALRSKGSDVGGLANAQPGDIVCYSGHVGLYIGGGQIVHASTEKTGIIVSNAGYRDVLSVRRIF